MKKSSLYLALLLSCFPSAVFATEIAHADHQSSTQHDYTNIQQINAALTIENATAKATIPGAKVSSGYMKIINNSDKAITLTGAATTIAKHTEFHRMFMRDSQMAMRKVDALEIPAKDSVTLASNGYHLMFMGVKNALKADQVITVRMQQANGEQFDVQLLVMPLKKY
ncbi:copper chaperone PCu(A)C [Photobacterium kishitanii]|uniref:copper chaperone PCu(A)C n=1 Tax=Photobacterium kishitanii TaxID=318456 RepID=UPI0005D3550E|nr:copper chaperone PCu(A)C [Photobacterium kishitanii]KJG10620.1 transporter [Photobacterium kishitanii]PSV07945.1 copper chaperone PCu(A)C [Photobacterium kishitanii]PSV75331.1 copper chaperone PCu(A)C [Photobacterium kishitanii]PSW47888.1 copper chaperone PCu(A)C [Photobacterium kishitanii]PSW71637.1 copper chaperone PCu(A)C [Photobacterium kishitanii]